MPRRTTQERIDAAYAALARCQDAGTGPVSLANDARVVAEFAARGIDPETIHPRENVFGYDVWRYCHGRQVRKGEKAVAVTTFRHWTKTVQDDATGKDKEIGGRSPSTAHVFHISQTDPIAEPVICAA